MDDSEDDEVYARKASDRKRKREEDDFGVDDDDEEDKPRATKFTLSSYLDKKPSAAAKSRVPKLQEPDLEKSASVSVSDSDSDSSSESSEADSHTKLKKLMQRCEQKTTELKNVLAKNNLQYEV